MLLRIGLSANFLHADPERALFKGKTLLYQEESLAHWVMKAGALAFLVPTLSGEGPGLPELVAALDGLVLTGGADVAPQTYGETPLKREWAGDAVRDAYELALVTECLARKVPILGVCRGAQLLNVALGGTLYQDIGTQVPAAFGHRNWNLYDENLHDVRLAPGSGLARLYPDFTVARVNSVHHQAVKDVGRDLTVEATAVDDGVVEAIRYGGPSYALGFQWHPEWHRPGAELLDGRPALEEFLTACRARKR